MSMSAPKKSREITPVDTTWLLFKIKRIEPQYLEQKQQEAKTSLVKKIGKFFLPGKHKKETRKLDFTQQPMLQNSTEQKAQPAEVIFADIILDLNHKWLASDFYKQIEKTYYKANPEKALDRKAADELLPSTDPSGKEARNQARLMIAEHIKEINDIAILELNKTGAQPSQAHSYARNLCHLLYEMNKEFVSTHTFEDPKTIELLRWTPLPSSFVKAPGYVKFDAHNIPEEKLGLLLGQIHNLETYPMDKEDKYQHLRIFADSIPLFIKNKLITPKEAISELGTMLKELQSVKAPKSEKAGEKPTIKIAEILKSLEERPSQSSAPEHR